MNFSEKRPVRVAILDLYEGVANQGMRCIREIINQFGEANNLELEWDEFEVRIEKQVPGMDYDLYISTGGPGNPIESEGSEWENVYFNWLSDIEDWNKNLNNDKKKYVFFICHSFQLACRYYDLATVCQRKSTSFGVFPIHLLPEDINEPILQGLPDPFYAVESRDFQVISPKQDVLDKIGATILAIEKERLHVPLERAIMAIRFNEYIVGTQFHPEADPIGMSMYLQTEEKKKTVVENHGLEKWQSMIEHLNDPDKILSTYSHIIPNFLAHAIEASQSVLA